MVKSSSAQTVKIEENLLPVYSLYQQKQNASFTL